MEPTEQTTTESLSGDEFWRMHLVAAEKFVGTDGQYCREHGLNHKTFSSYKTKFGFSRARKAKKIIAPRAFVEVKSQSGPKEEGALSARLPDAKWLAEFIVTVVRRIK